MANFKKSRVCIISAVICMLLRWVWHLCNLPCVSVLFWLISIARCVFKSPSIYFWGTNYDVYCERVAYLLSILWLELLAFASTATLGRFLSRVSYLPSFVFLRRRCSFTSRKLYAWLEKFLCFSCTIWSSSIGLFLLWFLTVLRVVYAIVRLSKWYHISRMKSVLVAMMG